MLPFLPEMRISRRLRVCIRFLDSLGSANPSMFVFAKDVNVGGARSSNGE